MKPRKPLALLLSLALACCAVAGCSDRAPPPQSAVDPTAETFAAVRKPEILVTGAALSGANGLEFGPDGLLYVASVIGSEIVVMDPRDGTVRRRMNTMDGVTGPDDLAFGPDGSMFWTSILTGEVAGFGANGKRIVAGNPGPGVNPVAFSADGRLFVAQCFFGDGLFEVDPTGSAEPRLITADLGPGCALNGMDWGTDGRLYGPRWFTGEVVSVDVASGEWRVEAAGFQVPAAVKFDGQGNLHVLDTATGQVLRLEDDGPVEVVRLVPGLDNFAFDLRNRLYVSSFADGFVVRIEPDGSRIELAAGGMSHPGGVAILPGPPAQVVVADLHALRGFDAQTGAPTFVQRNILGVGEMGSVLEVEADGENLILTSFTDNSVRIWDPQAERVLERHDGLAQPVSAVRYRGELVIAEQGTGRVIGIADGRTRVIADDLRAPAGLATDGISLFVTDRKRGRIFEIARDGEPIPKRRVIKKLKAPEGLAVHRDGLIVVEGETGRVYRVADGEATLVALVAPGTPPAAPTQPPSMIFNDVAVLGDVLYVSGETNRVLYRIDLASPGIAND
jgi:sugar lactone lactonase YvrE